MTRNKQGSRPGSQQQQQQQNASRPKSSDACLQKASALLKNIKQVWSQHGRRFTLWWSAQHREARLTFLLDWCPYMPLARDKPYLFVDGKKEDVSGAALVTPEWNQEELLEGHKLIDLIKETAEIPDAGEPGSAPGYNAITELCLQHVPAARQLAGQIRSSLSPQVYRSGIVMLLPEQLGGEYVVNTMVPSLQQMLEQGAAIWAREWEALLLRLDIHLTSMAMCLDHYRVEVLGRESYKAVGPANGCAGCGAVERSDGSGGRRLSCAACGGVFYCGKECQKAHWKEHKPSCKQMAASKTRAGSTAAATAADQAGGSTSSTDQPSVQGAGSTNPNGPANGSNTGSSNKTKYAS